MKNLFRNELRAGWALVLGLLTGPVMVSGLEVTGLVQFGLEKRQSVPSSMRRELFGSSIGPEIATTKAIFQALSILRSRKQEKRKPLIQDFRAAPARMTIFAYLSRIPEF